jgi:hypothetical protein
MFIRLAKIKDAKKIFDTVNKAYKIEIGKTGIAFKKVNRYITLGQVIKDIKTKNSKYFYLQKSKKNDDVCIGCVFATLKKEKGIVTYGPFAVHPKYSR